MISKVFPTFSSRWKSETQIPRSISAESAPRVLMVTPRYFPCMGGVETHVYEVARRLAALGVQITVLTTDLSGQLPIIEKVDGVTIQRVRAWPANRDFYWAPDIYRIIQEGGWDVVHLQSYHTLVAPLAMFAAVRAKIPYVVTFHGGGHSSGIRNRLRNLQQLLLRPLLARAFRLIAVARFESELYGKRLHLNNEQFVLIPNGCDIAAPPQLNPQAKSSGSADDTITIASIGRLERYKGHQRMIAALPYILKQRPNVRLWIAGAGPYESELIRLATELGVADFVKIRAIPGSQREVMAQEVSKAALVTILSDFETHPIAAIEALALGRPLLVTDTSGLHELAQNGYARAIPLSSTSKEIGEAVVHCLSQPLIPKQLQLPTWDECALSLKDLYLMSLQIREYR